MRPAMEEKHRKFAALKDVLLHAAAVVDHFDRITRLGSSDPDWQAYRQGAIDA